MCRHFSVGHQWSICLLDEKLLFPQPGENGTCNAPPDVENGIIFSSKEKIYRNNATVTYTCHQFYKIDVKDSITCNSGNWTDPPTCIGKY